VIRLVDRIWAQVCEKHIGEEAVGLLLVQLLEVGHPPLLGHLYAAPFSRIGTIMPLEEAVFTGVHGRVNLRTT
jgi:hypothetical protein